MSKIICNCPGLSPTVQVHVGLSMQGSRDMHALTCFTMSSGVSSDACTCVQIDTVDTRCTIQTRVAGAFVDVCNNNVVFEVVNITLCSLFHYKWVRFS